MSDVKTGHARRSAAIAAAVAASAAAWSPLAAPLARAESVVSFSIAVPRTAADIKIDGTIDDPAWRQAAHVRLGWDFQFHRPAAEQTDAYIVADATSLYVAFVAQQREPVTATIHTNDVTLMADDLTRVYLWPEGENGFEYGFVATPIGTRNEFSSENSSFAPRWTAVGKTTPTGYAITERIPLDVMRGDGRATWRVQFERVVHLTGEDFEWASDPAQHGVDSTQYAGFLTGMSIAKASARTKPRIGVYTLGQVGAPAAGGDTSHAGADISIPITDTSSFYGTLHPDYSNVDLDQQTISPTAFARQYQEVRPFFTQGANFYGNFNCNDCLDIPFLYTPNIPTPRDGYAVEGVQGLAQFGAFDALGGTGRSDDAQTLGWTTADRRLQVSAVRVATVCAAGCPSFGGTFTGTDEATLLQTTIGNRHNFSVYVTDGRETGANVAEPSLARYHEYGLNLYTSTSGFFPAYHDVGADWAPLDSLVQANDAHGPTAYTFKKWNLSPTGFIRSVRLDRDFQRLYDASNELHLADDMSGLNLTTRTQFGLSLSEGYQFLLLAPNDGIRIDQNGVGLTYGAETSAPTSITYNIGRFGPGYLRSTTRLTTLRLGPRGTLTLEGDNTDQTLDTGEKDVQWLERASVAFQVGSGSSIAVGARRIIGISPLLGYPQPQCLAPSPNPTTSCLDNANVSFAYYRHVGQDELYVVYGDPNRLTTLPAFIVKYVHYFGAEKGT